MIESVQSGVDGNTANLGFTASGTAIGGTAVTGYVSAVDIDDDAQIFFRSWLFNSCSYTGQNVRYLQLLIRLILSFKQHQLLLIQGGDSYIC